MTESRPRHDHDSPSADRARTRVVGILGGICSGKSAVSRALAGSDGVVIAADAIAHEALASPDVVARVRERFGPSVLGADGLPDRAALARLVFAQDAEGRGTDARRALEGWIHPVVRATISARLSEARARGVPVVVLDVPLLLENDAQHRLVRECDTLVFVDVDEAGRDLRARSTRGWDAGDVARREAAQLPLDEKRRRADHVLPNNGTLEELEHAVRALRVELGLG